MILDAEKAVIDYLTTNMISLVGTGNNEVEIHRHYFPDDSQAEAVVVYLELSESHGEVPGLMPASIRITTRAKEARKAFYLIQNVDLLLDLMVRKNFNADVECCICKRNSGPMRFGSINNEYIHYSALYSLILRSRA